ncbi:heavy-metal-associated domain-containing protein [Dactylosporangium sucinum]|uniref:Metal-binding protein n=1 Tax=Dactylosporangium sucinum TaxID=1424081 RepID=A0A917U3E3_9ACTN|nr:cation transporter [Dactylosporangium sucinum]GGM55375.1 putative metal-binding protein [Dactylosporangium sucinum]
MNEILLAVPGITCDHCVAAITDSVGRVPGVTAVHVDVAAKTVRTTGVADPAAVRAAIDDAGYETA